MPSPAIISAGKMPSTQPVIYAPLETFRAMSRSPMLVYHRDTESVEKHIVHFSASPGRRGGLYFQQFVSAIVFICVRPCSNIPPIILSWAMTMQNIFATKLLVPYIAHVTCVCSPTGLKLNSAI